MIYPEFIILIPVRLSSTRLKNKALRDVAGLPLFVRTARQASASLAIRTLVVTDNEEIALVGKKYGVEVLWRQETHDSGTDRLASAAQALTLPPDTIIVNVQGDEPLIDPMAINALALRLARGDALVATLAYPFRKEDDRTNPNAVKVVLNNREEALYFSRAPIPYSRSPIEEITHFHHVGLYAYRAHFLQCYHQLMSAPIEREENLEQLRILWHGYSISVLIWDRAPAPGVDTEEDLQYVIDYLKNKEKL